MLSFINLNFINGLLLIVISPFSFLPIDLTTILLFLNLPPNTVSPTLIGIVMSSFAFLVLLAFIVFTLIASACFNLGSIFLATFCIFPELLANFSENFILSFILISAGDFFIIFCINIVFAFLSAAFSKSELDRFFFIFLIRFFNPRLSLDLDVRAIFILAAFPITSFNELAISL